VALAATKSLCKVIVKDIVADERIFRFISFIDSSAHHNVICQYRLSFGEHGGSMCGDSVTAR